jgi:creatinine amidohydrolase/Fe(II)-dependent formamide hydrolase-like protein
LFLALVCGIAARAKAEESPRTPWLSDLTWTEARSLLADPDVVVVLPVGSMEARGPHLPLATRSLILSVVVEQAARKDGHVLIAPLLPVSPQVSEDDAGALRWPGTLHVSPGNLGGTLAEMISSLKVHGARRLLLVTNSPQALPVLRDTAAALGTLWAEQGVRVVVAENLLEPSRDAGLLSAQGINDEPPQARGGALETSEMLACCAAMVRMGHVPRTAAATIASGAEGRPSLADATLGRRSLRLQAAAIGQAIDAVR